MTGYDPQTLFELLPAAYQQRDAEQGFALRELIEILAEQSTHVEGGIEQLYRDGFIETCQDSMVSYVGDLIGVRPSVGGELGSRAEVANTLGYRRRKGTLAVVEQLARDVTGWPAKAVEYFTLLSTQQNLNHQRPQNLATPDFRDRDTLARLQGPFERTPHLVEVREIEPRAGRYNVPNVGIHLWIYTAYEVRRSLAHRVDDGTTDRHFTFDPLGVDAPLLRRPEEIEAPFDLANERQVPDPTGREQMRGELADLYGLDASIAVWEGEALIASSQVAVCDLSGWLHEVPEGRHIAIDPVLGRISFAAAPAAEVRVLYHYGFGADLGAGPYHRAMEAPATAEPILRVGADPALEPIDGATRFATLGEALEHWMALPPEDRPGVIEIEDNGTYPETLPDTQLPAQSRLAIRAASNRRPVLILGDTWHIDGEADSGLALNGLLIAGAGLEVTGELAPVNISHSTLVPGRSLDETGAPQEPGASSLEVAAATARVRIQRSILGPLRTAPDTVVRLEDTIIDAGELADPAFEGLEADTPAGSVELRRSTVLGTLRAHEMSATDTLFVGLVRTERRQSGCLRFCHVPPDSITPRRFHCQPDVPANASSETRRRLAAAVRPRFISMRYGDAGYCQLRQDAPPELRRGAEDEAEIGAYASLRRTQREDALRQRLDEYLRLGMRAGVFFVE
jgi:hypothetical protein